MIPDPIVGLKVGLEIHQQLGRQGSRKLFCQCPGEIVDRKPDVVVRRQLRAAAGETGEVDVAAAAEQSKAKRFAYGAHREYTCLVELDEEPPHPCDTEALETVLMVAKACGTHILPRVQFMRKTIVDGSNVSGFQRTGLVALGGVVPGTKVRIQTIALEEDAAKIISRTSEEDTYDLSRLGIPLIELATEPDITTPEQAKETAAQIGMILRSTRRVKRGLGTIRQDLNVSIKGGARVEIKGCQDLRQIPQIVENEIRRQQALLALKAKIPHSPTVHETVDVTAVFKDSTAGFVKKAIAGGAKAVGVRVEHLNGILGIELMPNHRVGSELADIARSQGFGGLIHSDEDMAKYGADKDALRHAFGCAQHDAFMVLIGDPHRIQSTFHGGIASRIAMLSNGVPKEVRKANPDATSSFLRPMSGGARMYPETDIPVVEIDLSNIPPITLLSDQIASLARETGLSTDITKSLIADDIDIHEYHRSYPKLSYQFLGAALVTWPRELLSKFSSTENERFDVYAQALLPMVQSGSLGEAAVKSLMEEAITKKTPAKDLEAFYREGHKRYEQMPDEDVRKNIRAIVAKHPGVTMGAMMGIAMKDLRGKADGKVIERILREEIASSL